MKNVLEDVGLTDIETKVYLYILKKGSVVAGKISKETGIHRRTVYDAIERLIEKGLISYIRINNKRYFESVNPKRLLEIAKERQETIQKVLPDLEAQFKFIHESRTTKERKETVFFRGKKAIQNLFYQQMEKPGIVFYMGDSEILTEIFRHYFKKYDSTRKELDIHIRAITDFDGKNNEIINSLENCEIKAIKPKYNNKTVISGYDNNLVILNWKEDPIAILIKEKEIKEGFEDYFNLMWGMSK